MSNRHKSQTTQSNNQDIPSLESINNQAKQNKYPLTPVSEQRNLNNSKNNSHV